MTSARARQRNQATFAALAETLAHRVVRDHPPPATVRRDAHPKHHGCVDATFTVHRDVPERLCHGVFQPGVSYRALIRFSNAFKVAHDLKRDARGMAIKLTGVEGCRVRLPNLDGTPTVLLDEGEATQDFLLVTHSEFFTRNATEFIGVINALVGGSSAGIALPRRFFGIRPLRFQWRNFVALVRTRTVTSNPLFLKYFSQSPYRVGPCDASSLTHSHAVKFCVRPKQRPSVVRGVAFAFSAFAFTLFGRIPPLRRFFWPDGDFLKTALADFLGTREAVFEFCIQERTHADRMPLDNASRPWPKSLSAFRPVATITIHHEPRYRSDPQFVEERMALGERLSYTPWHALEAHRPLGSINRARLFVYARVSRTRSAKNGTSADVPRA